jgi:alpha-L-fucosidase
MIASQLAAVFGALTFLLTLFGVVFVGGKLVRTVEDQGLALERHAEQLQDYGIRLGKNETEIFGLTRWHDGYEARKGDEQRKSAAQADAKY